MREIEIKLQAPDLKIIEQKLAELGCKISEPITQEDTNFIHKDDISWFKESRGNFLYPRLRKQEGAPLKLTIKKPLSNEMDCIEHEIEVNDAEEVKNILKLFDYVEGVTVKKTRRTCTWNDYSLTLDEVDSLGSFIEIERVMADGDAEKIQKEMFVFAKENFNLERDENVMKGYDILTYYKFHSEEIG